LLVAVVVVVAVGLSSHLPELHFPLPGETGVACLVKVLFGHILKIVLPPVH